VVAGQVASDRARSPISQGGPVDSAAQGGDPVQYEIGITRGTTETTRVWQIPLPLPRLGIGYRFGSNLDVFRIVIGTPF
jgi:hypothetical protein